MAGSWLPQAGELLAGKYRIGRTLGSGAMGLVLEAQHEKLGVSVALKFLHPDAGRGGSEARRFAREARATARLKNPHVVRILDVDETSDGVPYIVMEQIVGDPLDVAARRPGASGADVLEWLAQVCDALSEAHAAGIVHRDLKPSNILVTSSTPTAAKVVDFGVSKMVEVGDSLATAHNVVLGTPRYMAPEQLTTPNIDARADIWALGVIAYELFAGAPPFTAPTFFDLGLKIRTHVPEPLTTLRPDLPERLGAVVSRAMAKRKADRYATAAELGGELRAVARELRDAPARATASRVPTLPLRRAPEMTAILKSDDASIGGLAASSARGSRMSVWAGVCLVVIAIGGGAAQHFVRARAHPAVVQAAVVSAPPATASPPPIESVASASAAAPALAVPASSSSHRAAAPKRPTPHLARSAAETITTVPEPPERL
jgi:eukaryotic-like serine/threonine-protein kinase